MRILEFLEEDLDDPVQVALLLRRKVIKNILHDIIVQIAEGGRGALSHSVDEMPVLEQEVLRHFDLIEDCPIALLSDGESPPADGYGAT